MNMKHIIFGLVSVVLALTACDKNEYGAPDKDKYIYDIPQTSLSSDALTGAYYYNYTTAVDAAKSPEKPMLGYYTTTEHVMKQHIAWADKAGLDFFIFAYNGSDTDKAAMDMFASARTSAGGNVKYVIRYDTGHLNVTNDNPLESEEKYKLFITDFVDVLADFAEFLPEDNASIMDDAVQSFGNDLAGRDAVLSAVTAKTGENEYSVDFSVSDISTFIGSFGIENQSLFTLTDGSFAFHLDISNYGELKEIVPFLADPNFEVYGPEYNQGMSDADYLEMISFLLGEDGPEAIRNGLVTVRISVPGTITATENAEAVDSSTAEFSFPIISFLLLNDPISFSIGWE